MRSRRHAGIIPFASTGGTIDGVMLTLFKVETPSDPAAGAPLCHPANEPAAALLSLEVLTSLLGARQQTPSMAPSHAILSRENSKQEGGEGKAVTGLVISKINRFSKSPMPGSARPDGPSSNDVIVERTSA